MNYKWVPIAGDFDQEDHVVTFKGKAIPATAIPEPGEVEPRKNASIGILVIRPSIR